MENTIEMYDGKVYGVKVSEIGLERGYLDYRALANILEDCILNNTIREQTMTDWEIVAGEFDEMIMSDYIISRRGYEFLKEHTDEIVFYNEALDVYIWGVTHWGTSWDYELTMENYMYEFGARLRTGSLYFKERRGETTTHGGINT